MNFRLLKRLFLFTLGLSIMGGAQGQTLSWVNRFDGGLGQNEYMSNVAVDSKHNIYAVSSGEISNPNITIIKYDQGGHILWTRTINGTDPKIDSFAFALSIDAQDNVVVGATLPFLGQGTDFVTAKYDSNGNQMWVRTYNGSANGDDLIYKMAIDSQNNVVVTGYSSEQVLSATTIRYSPNGATLWVDKLSNQGYASSIGDAVGVDAAGNSYIISEGVLINGSESNLVVRKLDPNGNQLWSTTWSGPGGSYDGGYSAVVTPSGRVVTTGITYSAATGYDTFTLSLNTNGAIQWQQVYSGSGPDYGFELDVDQNGNTAVVGETITPGGFTIGHILYYDISGNPIWSATVQHPSWVLACSTGACKFDSAGNLITSSIVWSGPSRGYDSWVSKWSPAGSEVWRYAYDSPTHHDDLSGGIALDKQANVFVPMTGGSLNTGSDALMMKLEQATRIAISDFTIFRGTYLSGNVASLTTSEDNRLNIQKGFTANASEAPVQLILNGTAPNNSTSQLNLTFETSANSVNIRQRIELFDWTTNSYVNVDERPATTSDTMTTLAITTNPSRFVAAGTKAVRAKVSYFATGIVTQSNWKVAMDQAFFGQL